MKRYRKKIVAGNWKMNKSTADAEVLALIDASGDSARAAPAPGADIMLSDVYIDY